MKTVNESNINETPETLDTKTIRERVQRIRASWSSQTAKERAEEGKRRRAELEQLLLGNPAGLTAAKCDFTLVG
jgi:hypothetical protein